VQRQAAPPPAAALVFYIISVNMLFLFCIQDMDKMGVRLNNLKNILIQDKKIVSVVCK
jgi:hypothetical protein